VEFARDSAARRFCCSSRQNRVLDGKAAIVAERLWRPATATTRVRHNACDASGAVAFEAPQVFTITWRLSHQGHEFWRELQQKRRAAESRANSTTNVRTKKGEGNPVFSRSFARWESRSREYPARFERGGKRRLETALPDKDEDAGSRTKD